MVNRTSSGKDKAALVKADAAVYGPSTTSRSYNGVLVQQSRLGEMIDVPRR